jgi:hypothetical protein
MASMLETGNQGGVRLYLGGPQPSAADWNGASPSRRIDLPSTDGASAFFGRGLGGVGDVDGDGLADFALGSIAQGGLLRVYFGESSPMGNDWNGRMPANRTTFANPKTLATYFGYSIQ